MDAGRWEGSADPSPCSGPILHTPHDGRAGTEPVHFRRHHQTGPDAQGTARTTGPLPTGAVGSGWVPDLTAPSFSEALGCPRGTCWPAGEGMGQKGGAQPHSDVHRCV